MTDTTITHAPSTSIPAPARTPNRRKGAAAVAAGLAFAAIAGSTALVALSGSDSTGRPAVASAERSAPAEAGFTMSADAYARWAEAEAEAYERRAAAEANERTAKLDLSERAASSRPAAPSAATEGSADAAEREAQLELSHRAAACRADTASPYSLVGCLGRGGG